MGNPAGHLVRPQPSRHSSESVPRTPIQGRNLRGEGSDHHTMEKTDTSPYSSPQGRLRKTTGDSGATPQLWQNLQNTFELRMADIQSGKEITERVQPGKTAQVIGSRLD